ncbi:MAG: dephospho-CoA kinase [Chlamydiae bacterium]|nr:dephospho-CoA kinase [Chlamydiota bacterium]
MLILRKIAVTGGLSSGKTSVCQILKKFGAYVVDADEIVHQLLSPKTKIGQEIIQLLGKEIISGDELDRAKIAKKVFSHPEKLQNLEKIIHPAVIHEIERQYSQVKKKNVYSLFVAEIPLLYESENEHLFDCVIAVVASPEIARSRFLSQPHREAEEFEKRMSRQWDMTQKAAKADFIIQNNGSFSDLEKSIKQIYPDLMK